MKTKHFYILTLAVILSSFFTDEYLFAATPMARIRALIEGCKNIYRDGFSTEAIRGNLISLKQIDYLSSFKFIINPDSKPMTVFYGGMGPDFITSSLATNATELWGVDYSGYDLEKLKHYLNIWDAIDTYDFGPTSRRGLEIRDYLRNLGIDPVAHPELVWKWDFQRRKDLGYWDLSAIDTWGLERLLIAELKRAGVEKSGITLKGLEPHIVEMNFVWAYPGEKPKNRILKLIKDDIFGVLNGETKISYPQFDVAYIKSIPAMSVGIESTIEKIPLVVRNKGYFFIGGTFGSPKAISKYESDISNPNFKAISPNLKAQNQMINAVKKIPVRPTAQGRFDYGWRLYLFQYSPN